jgi:RNA polymerase sigma factor (TIGR02999 family)
MEAEWATSLLQQANAGDEKAFQRLVSVAYRELRSIAGFLMRGRENGHTLQPTALVNEAYLRLVRGREQWDNKAHFFGAAARAMRQVLIGHARQRSACKRSAGDSRVPLTEVAITADDTTIDVELLDEAMTALAAINERLARVIELRYFAGCSLPEVASITELSVATVKRDWTFARAWLYDYMSR